MAQVVLKSPTINEYIVKEDDDEPTEVRSENGVHSILE